MSDGTTELAVADYVEHQGRDVRDGDIAGALRTVILHVLTDAFGLLPEESLWAGFHLERTFEPLSGLSADAVPLAVRHELLTGEYARALGRAEASESPGPQPVFDPSCLHAGTADWAGVLMLMVTTCFALRPLVESSIHGQIVGLLRELGVGQRPARYLPNDIRARLAETA